MICSTTEVGGSAGSAVRLASAPFDGKFKSFPLKEGDQLLLDKVPRKDFRRRKDRGDKPLEMGQVDELLSDKANSHRDVNGLVPGWNRIRNR